MKHLTTAPDLTKVPAVFRPVVVRLLDKEPARRYSSLQAMITDLNGWLAGAPVAEVWQESGPVTALPASHSGQGLGIVTSAWAPHNAGINLVQGSKLTFPFAFLYFLASLFLAAGTGAFIGILYS